MDFWSSFLLLQLYISEMSYSHYKHSHLLVTLLTPDFRKLNTVTLVYSISSVLRWYDTQEPTHIPLASIHYRNSHQSLYRFYSLIADNAYSSGLTIFFNQQTLANCNNGPLNKYYYTIKINFDSIYLLQIPTILLKYNMPRK